MKQRCLNPKSPGFKDYGGRGITVCKRWMKFANFRKDMGPRPAGLQIDRKDNNKGYSPSNCRWATRKENNNNRRSSVFITMMGQTKTIAQWSDHLGVRFSLLYNRIYRKWPVDRLTEKRVPKKTGRTILTFRGKQQYLTAWAREIGIHPRTLSDRINQGWPVELALSTPTLYGRKRRPLL